MHQQKKSTASAPYCRGETREARLADLARPAGAEVTELLRAWSAGDSGAQDPLFEAIYPELRRLARSKLRADRQDLSIQATDLAHEAYLKLVDQRQVDWRSRGHFLAIAATIIRRILVDRMRYRQRGKRGGGALHIALDAEDLPFPATSLDLLALDRALNELTELSLTAARIVELRFFAGLGVEDTAEVMGVSRQTVVRKWRFARAFLARQLGYSDS